MRVLICGSRTVSDFGAVRDSLDERFEALLSDPVQREELVIVHGAAQGADTAGGQWAERMGLPVEVYPADWNRFGRSAGFRRNEEMIRTGIDFVVAFVDKPLAESVGTAGMVELAKKAGVHGVVVTLRTGGE